VNSREITDTLTYHTELFPGAWQDGKLLPEVRYRLLQAAQHFLNYLKVPGFKLRDIVLTGSMANYNWTRFSDFDVHLITRYQDLECDNLAEEFYQAKKTLWNNQHDILIQGHEIEMYVEDQERPPVSAGVYSLLDDRWLSRPRMNPPDYDKTTVKIKAQDMMKQIDSALAQANDAADVTRITDKLKKMRRSGLDTGGEFSVENLVFKILRNTGYLDRLRKLRNQLLDAELSLNENFQDGTGPGRPGDSARHGIPRNSTLAQLKRIRGSDSAGPRKKQLAHWQINMRQGRTRKNK
jgi:hypothetical protein